MTKQDPFIDRMARVADVILAAGAVVSAICFAYFVYLYGWSAQRRVSGWKAMLVYYVVPVLLATLLFASLRFKRDHRINLAIVIIALALSIYSGEIVLSLTEPLFARSIVPVMVAVHRSDDPRKMAARLAKERGVPIDARDTLEVITDLRAKGMDAVPSVIARYQLRYHQQQDRRAGGAAGTPAIIALAGISNKMTVLCNESGQFVMYESDEHGFRNPKGLWQSGRPDIVTLGDSFTQGYCVDSGRYFVDVIRQRHPATLNLGMAGEGPLLMLSALREYAPHLRPRRVLWFYFEGNDFMDLAEERTSALLMRYLDDHFSQKLVERQAEVDRALVEFVEREKRAELARRDERARSRLDVVGRALDFVRLSTLRSRLGLGQLTSDSSKPSGDVSAGDMDLFRQILSRAKTTVESWGGVLYFVYLPNWTRYDKRPVSGDQRVSEAHRDRVLKVVRALELPIIDVLPAFDAEPDPMALFPFRAPGHYTEQGHELVGREVLKVLATRASVDGPRR